MLVFCVRLKDSPNVGQSSLFGLEFINDTLNKFHMIRNQLKITYSRQQSFADTMRRNLEFIKGDKVYFKISPIKELMRFVKKGKLSPRYVGPYEILQKGWKGCIRVDIT